MASFYPSRHFNQKIATPRCLAVIFTRIWAIFPRHYETILCLPPETGCERCKLQKRYRDTETSPISLLCKSDISFAPMVGSEKSSVDSCGDPAKTSLTSTGGDWNHRLRWHNSSPFVSAMEKRSLRPNLMITYPIKTTEVLSPITYQTG